MVWRSLRGPSWPGIHGHPSALTSCTLRLQGCTTPSFAYKCLISTEAFTEFLRPQFLVVLRIAPLAELHKLKHLHVTSGIPPHVQSTIRHTGPALQICDAGSHFSVCMGGCHLVLSGLAAVIAPPPPPSLFPHGGRVIHYNHGCFHSPASTF